MGIKPYVLPSTERNCQLFKLHTFNYSKRKTLKPGLTVFTCGSSYDDDTEELTWFANQVVWSQEDFTRCKRNTQKWLDSLFLSVFVLSVQPHLHFSDLTNTLDECEIHRGVSSTEAGPEFSLKPWSYPRKHADSCRRTHGQRTHFYTYRHVSHMYTKNKTQGLLNARSFFVCCIWLTTLKSQKKEKGGCVRAPWGTQNKHTAHGTSWLL